MKKAKRILSAVVAGVMVLSLSACGRRLRQRVRFRRIRERPAAGSTPAGAEGKITISLLTTNRHDQAYMTPLIEEFNATNDKNIYIDFQVYADNYSQMLIWRSAQTQRRMCTSLQVRPDRGRRQGEGAASDLAPYMDDEYRARFGEGAFVEGINALGTASICCRTRLCRAPVL